MRKEMRKHLLLFGIVFLFFSCKKEKLLVPAIDMTYSVNFADTVFGQPVISNAIGTTNLYCIDSLLFLESTDPNGQLKAYSMNDYNIIANLCCKGRARNEFINPTSSCKQFFRREGHIFLLMYDNYSNIKMIDITESIKKKTTVVENVESAIVNSRKGFSIYVSSQEKWFNYYKISYIDPRDGYNPARFTISNNEKEKEIPIYGDAMELSEGNEGLKNFVYEGSMRIKPDQSKIVFTTFYMPYMFIFDVKNGGVTVFHEKDKLSYCNPYPEIEDWTAIEYFYGDITVTDDYIICSCPYGTQGDYIDPARRPCIRIFNWEGEYLSNFFVDRRIFSITYDEEKKILYGLDTSEGQETIYKYDINQYVTQ